MTVMVSCCDDGGVFGMFRLIEAALTMIWIYDWFYGGTPGSPFAIYTRRGTVHASAAGLRPQASRARTQKV
jgi:hypothetical protein